MAAMTATAQTEESTHACNSCKACLFKKSQSYKNAIYASYDMQMGISSYRSDYDYMLQGATVGYSRAFDISKGKGLNLNAGGQFSYASGTETFSYAAGNEESKLRRSTFTIPVTVSYDITIANCLIITPSAGMQANLRMTSEWVTKGEGFELTYNLLNSEYLTDENTQSRMNFGYQFGLDIQKSRYFIGVHYLGDIGREWKDLYGDEYYFGTISIRAGLKF